jgi:hypothetical protein
MNLKRKAGNGKTFTEITEQKIRLAPEKKRGSIPWLSTEKLFSCPPLWRGKGRLFFKVLWHVGKNRL